MSRSPRIPALRPNPAALAFGDERRGGAAANRLLKAIARHVSREGCQFIFLGPRASAGQRLAFALDAGPSISGSVCWALENRVGFAFDRPIGEAALAEMARHYATFTALVLRPCQRREEERG